MTVGRVRPAVAAMASYRPGKSAAQAEDEHGITDAIKLASNENPYQPVPAIVAAIAAAAGDVNRYGDHRAGDQRWAHAAWRDVDVVRVALDGTTEVLAGGGGVRSAAVGGGVVVVSTAGMDGPPATIVLPGGHLIASHVEEPMVRPEPTFHVVGERDLRAAVLVPDGHDGSPLPVLLDPYGGPHAQRVQRARGQFLTSQWFADQGFAVVVTDGRGTPGRGPEWERAVHGDLAAPVLDDQVDALQALSTVDDRLDLGRVAVR